MFDFLLSIVTSKWFYINWIVGIILCEYAFQKTKPVRKVDEERDSKYPAFRRYDVKNWNRLTFYIGISIF